LVDVTDLYLLNLIVTIVLTIGTFYRIKIEREHTKATISELKFKKRLQTMRSVLVREKELVLDLKTAKDIRELYDFLLECLADAD
jgi:hypothetical protein